MTNAVALIEPDPDAPVPSFCEFSRATYGCRAFDIPPQYRAQMVQAWVEFVKAQAIVKSARIRAGAEWPA